MSSINAESVDLANDQSQDAEVGERVRELIKLCLPNDSDLPCIPFMLIRPIFAAREPHDARYRVSAVKRRRNGLTAVKTNTLAVILGHNGLLDDACKRLWEKLKSAPPLEKELNPPIEMDNDMWSELESRYETLEARYESLWTEIDCHDTYMEDTKTFPRYNFAFYERWERDANDPKRVRRFLKLLCHDDYDTDGVPSMLYHDELRPAHKLVFYCLRFGLDVNAFQTFVEAHRKAMESEDLESYIQNDSTIKYYETLCML